MNGPSSPSERTLAIGEISRTDFVKFAGAGGDFNPMHHDDEFARASGFPSVFAMGMFTASIASRLVTDWFGLAAVRSYGVRFRAMVWPGESLTVRGRLAAAPEGTRCSIVEFEVVNEAGEVKLTGTAEVEGEADAGRA
jgi:acyl dehydratase